MSTIHNGHAPDVPAREQFQPHLRRKSDALPAPATRLDGPVRVLLINGAPRSDGSWAGEAAKTWRLTELARATLAAEGVATEVLDLGVMPSGEDRAGWAEAVRAGWLAAHGVIVLAPAHGDALDGMREVLVRLEQRELLADRVYGIVVHGDMAAIRLARGALSEWLDGLGLVDSDSFGPLNKFVGYYEPDEDAESDGNPAAADPVDEEEVQNVARAVHKAVTELRAGRLAGVTCAPALEERA